MGRKPKPNAKLILIACDASIDSLALLGLIQQATPSDAPSAWVDVEIDPRELTAPVAQVMPRLMEPMLVRLQQLYPKAP